MSFFDNLMLWSIADSQNEANEQQARIERRKEALLRSVARLVNLSERLSEFQEIVGDPNVTYDEGVHRAVIDGIRQVRKDINRERNIIHPPPQEPFFDALVNEVRLISRKITESWRKFGLWFKEGYH